MAEITISVDNATLEQWTAAIAVLQRTYSIPLTFIAPIPNIGSTPTVITVTGERLLLEIGRACSRPEILDDPARLFAVLRYASAISDRYSVLTLSEPFYRLDTHKKKVLSDEFGCGLAFILLGELFGAAAVMDFETAIARKLVETPAPKSRRPDYAARLPSGRLVILEAKGTQSGSGYARDRQVPSGCVQAAGVQVAGVGAPQIDARVVAAISLSFEHWGPFSEGFVGDPGADRPELYDFREDVAVVVTRTHYSRVAAFIGDTELGVALSRGREHVPSTRLPMSQRTVDGTSYLGTNLTIDAGEVRVRFFVGLDAKLRESLLRRLDFEALVAARSYGAKLLYEREPVSAHVTTPAERTPGEGETTAAAVDGTVWITTVER